MNSFKSIQAPAKLNLNLFITGKSSNGLHLLNSHICFLELTDQIFIRNNLQDVFYQMSNNKSLLINPDNNLILSTIDVFRRYTNWKQNFKVILDKKIPIGAGLGGGSADAAATLILLKHLHNIDKNNKEKIKQSALYKIALSLGSDVPACLKSRDLILSGLGEKLQNCNIPNNYYFLLINPNIHLSTKDVFTHYEKNKIQNNHSINFANLQIYNSLLSSAIFLVPEISNIIIELKKAKNIITCGMTGSGSTCFGIFKNIDDIKTFLGKFNKNIKIPYYTWYGGKKNYSFNRITNSKVLENNF